ncbi:DUF1616 domain-containing protein [Natrinema altunense]|uniref:DUF1616 domain-containing protein n=1 Tax=Natrinema altunense (strain JCM 12890 / CGMCC 1.3731 / AJ2) TaxID=1227494 RepID=L9ZCY4_NATA2|nr:DUF1616 domain-containing protein [Natrinema altunense]ELY84355.1 hypothetical protein C485_15416 [Natrinema altunense JCM 12890]
MAGSSSPWRLLPRPVREVPADLAAVIAVVVATNLAVFAPIVRDTWLRVPLGLLFVLFGPGYSFVAALFPERATRSGRGGDTTGDGDEFEADPVRPPSLDGPITDAERAVLSVASSVAIVPLLGLSIHFAPVAIRLRSIAVVLSAVTVAMAAVATARRRSIPPEARFRPPYRRWVAAAQTTLFDPDSRAETGLAILVATTLVLAVGGVGYAVTAPQHGETFTEVAVLTDTDGEPTADVPSSAADNGTGGVFVTLENNERRTVSYTVVAVAQRIESDGEPGTTTVLEQTELRRFEPRLAHGETWTHSHDIEPTLTGDTVRVAWLVYADADVPATPTLENADYSAHRWVNASRE